MRDRSLFPRILRTAMWGAIIGVSLVVTGYIRRSLGFGSPPQPNTFWPGVLIGVVGGPVVALGLLPTAALRRRGIVGHYLSWVIACVFAGATLMWLTGRSALDAEFGALMGFLGGLGLGAWSRGTGIGTAAAEENEPSSGPAA